MSHRARIFARFSRRPDPGTSALSKPQKMDSPSERDQDFQSEFDDDSEDGFDALEIELPSGNRTLDADPAQVTPPSAPPSQSFHGCQSCCLWVPFGSPSTSPFLYTLRSKDAIFRGTKDAEQCAFLQSIRAHMRGPPIPDDSRLFLKIQNDRGDAAQFIWGSGQGEIVACSGQVHPGRLQLLKKSSVSIINFPSQCQAPMAPRLAKTKSFARGLTISKAL